LKSQGSQSFAELFYGCEIANHVYPVAQDDERQQLVAKRRVFYKCVIFTELLLQLLDVERLRRRSRTLATVMQLARDFQHLVFALVQFKLQLRQPAISWLIDLLVEIVQLFTQFTNLREQIRLEFVLRLKQVFLTATQTIDERA